MRLKKGLFFILVFISLGITCYIIPFLFVKYHKLDFTYTVLFSIAKKETNLTKSEEGKIILLYTYIRNNIKKPTKIETSNISVLGTSGKHLMTGQGYCDEQCNTFLSLANTLNFQGRLIFLYANDSISNHSVCEILINKQYCMFDPFYGLTIRDQRGELMDVKAITENVNFIKKTPKNSGISIEAYKAFYNKKYAYKIAKHNQIIRLPKEKRIHTIYSLWYNVFGESFRKRLFSYYYKINKIHYKEQQRINKLFQ